MSGKVIGIWVPTSTYVICGFEHVIASMFFMSCAKLNNPSAFKVADMLLFLIPSTLGNLVGGALMIGLGLFNIPKKSRGVQNDP
jgi:formate/nitrite transporter FocA (FNT family)